MSNYKDQKASKACKERANGLCEFCGLPGNQTHHMVSRREKPLRLHPANLVWVCDTCHANCHSNEREYWHRFLNIRAEECLYVLDVHPSEKKWFDLFYIIVQDCPDRQLKKGDRVKIQNPSSLKASLGIIDGREVLLYADEFVSVPCEVVNAQDYPLPRIQRRRSA